MTELPSGFRAAGLASGIKRSGAPDLGLIALDEARPAACVFTTNALLGAHIPVCREHLQRSGGLVRAVLVNSGNANCAVGAEGLDDAILCAEAVATALGCPTDQVLPISTGVIGARLPVQRIQEAVPKLVDALDASGADAFGEAIRTTDTGRKLCTESLGTARATGIAKGSGMIHPDMATMLGFLLTDAAISHPATMLAAVTERSFHRLSVDGDTSPNDTVVLWGSGAHEEHAELEPALTRISQDLCRQIARDGEGATRLITIQIRGARDEEEAAAAARTIATSPLVKTAVAGRDPNWGRILSAAGRSGATLDLAKARVWVGSQDVFSGGVAHPENEAAAAAHFRDDEEVLLGVDLGTGEAELDYWSCDLTADYVRINADYRT